MTPKWKIERHHLLRNAERFQEDRVVSDIENSRTPRAKGETEMITEKMATKIYPGLAAKWLEANTHNRPLRQHHIRKLAAMMSEGRWNLNGDTIVFSDAGSIIDGQHRLHAVIRSGVTIKAFVIHGLSEDAFATKDRCKARSGGDALSVSGYQNANLLAAVVKLVHRISTGTITQQHYRNGIEHEPQMVLEMLSLYPHIESSLRTAKTFPAFPLSVLSACHYLFSCVDKIDAEKFIHMVETGENLPKYHPALTLRDRIIVLKNTTQTTVGLRQEYIAAITIKAWNAWRNKEEMKLLRFRDTEEYPEIM
jgi:hypothetical protein